MLAQWLASLRRVKAREAGLSPEPPQEPEEKAVPESQDPAGAESPMPVEPEPEPATESEPEPPLVQDEPVALPPSPPPPPKAAKPRRPGGFDRFIRALFIWGFVLTVVLPVGVTLVYRFVPPPITILMVQRVFQGKGLDYRWRRIDRISPALVQAAIAAEDARFCEHNGFDFEAIERAMASNKRRPNRIRGGSTISQQTAKNVFLWPQRSYVRKGLEAYYTVLIETLWGKRRIMEVYLNVAEMGAGTYGAEAAARRYFGVGADQLTRAQAARLVAILPNPLKYKAVQSGPYVARRSRRIGAAAGTVRNDGLAACVGRLRPPTRREREEPAPVQKPAKRQPAPEKRSDPLPPADAAPPPPALESAPAEPAPVVEPEFTTTD